MFSNQSNLKAHFYNQQLGIPFELNQHGHMLMHYECLFQGIHFAITKGKSSLNSVIPVFVVDNLKGFAENLINNGIKTMHPIIDLGDDKSICSFIDIEGNQFRLIQLAIVQVAETIDEVILILCRLKTTG